MPGYHLGLAAETGARPTGIAPPGIDKPDWSFKTGLFSTSVDQGCTSCAGAPASGSQAYLGPVAGGHQFWDAAARPTYAPILTDDSVLHVGASIRYEDPNDSTAFANNRVLQPGGTSKSEANILNESLLGTQPLTCVAAPLSPSTQTSQLVGGNCTKSVLGYAFEASANYGPISVQGEYIGVHYNRDAEEILVTGSPGAASVNFSGYYAYAALFLTGETRAASYQTSANYMAPGTFGQLKINNPVSAGGPGAWELAARVSELNLNSGGYLVLQPIGTSSNIQGGRQTDFTLGLNWYPDIGIRFMFNWVNVLELAAPYNRPDLNGIHPQLFVARSQVNW